MSMNDHFVSAAVLADVAVVLALLWLTPEIEVPCEGWFMMLPFLIDF